MMSICDSLLTAISRSSGDQTGGHGAPMLVGIRTEMSRAGSYSHRPSPPKATRLPSCAMLYVHVGPLPLIGVVLPVARLSQKIESCPCDLAFSLASRINTRSPAAVNGAY